MPVFLPAYTLSLKKIKEYMDSYNFKPKKKLGQNFLTDNNIIAIMVQALNLDKEEAVFEIGTGFGSLTIALIPYVRHIFSVENDTRFKPILNEILAPYDDSITVLYQDILTFDLAYFLQQKKQEGYHIEKLVGNLPYSISLPLLRKIMDLHGNIKTAVLMVQKEVAERMLAKPGSKNYGLLSVLSSYYAQIEKIHLVKPNVFFPKPIVDSLILKIQFLSEPSIEVADEALFFKVMGAIFQYRRKRIDNALLLYFGESLSKESLADIFLMTGIDPGERGDNLPLTELSHLTAALKGLLPETPS